MTTFLKRFIKKQKNKKNFRDNDNIFKNEREERNFDKEREDSNNNINNSQLSQNLNNNNYKSIDKTSKCVRCTLNANDSRKKH